mgnify:CR=1 FL=1
MIPYNYVYCSDAQQLANEMSTGNKTSSLMYGIQYYINEDSTSWGNYFDSIFKIDSVKAKEDNNSSYIDVTGDKPFFSSMLLTTGASEYTNKMNIYDFAGNEYEWTLEKSTSTKYYCSARGGCYGSHGNLFCSASNRNNNSTTYSDNRIGLRVSLY